MKVIGECGVNFKDIDEAKEMIKKSKEIGLWSSKFQLYNNNNIKDTPENIQSFLRSIQLSFKDTKELYDYGQSIGQEVFFSVMFESAVDWCEKLNVRYYKVRHKDNHNLPLYRKIKKSKKFTFISINNENDLWRNYVNYGKGVFLYCVPKYPSRIEDYKQAFEKGYMGISGHTESTELLKKAIDHNIQYFEIHVKLNNTKPLEDKWSVQFSDLKEVLK